MSVSILTGHPKTKVRCTYLMNTTKYNINMFVQTIILHGPENFEFILDFKYLIHFTLIIQSHYCKLLTVVMTNLSKVSLKNINN